MRHLTATLVLLAIAACQHGGSPSPAADALPDTALLLPGSFSEQTTLADLRARFGASNVKIAALPDDRGNGVVLFADDPTRRAYVRFYDDPSFEHMASVTVTDPESRWSGKLGVKIGTTFAELRERNGVEFWFTGFDASHGGMVRDAWNAGALDVGEGENLYFGVDLRLRDPVQQIPATAYPRGNDMISSEDLRYPKLGELAVVSSITAWSSLDDE